jgi:signal peptidase I
VSGNEERAGRTRETSASAREALGDRSHLVALMPDGRMAAGTYRVPDGHYFVLGDDRDNSLDSRYPDFGFVPGAGIVGKVIFVWWNDADPTRAGIVLE